MAVIRPFNALRPAPEVVNQVASVPYDVVNTKEARAFAEGNPFSLLNVTRSEIHFPDNTNPYSDEIYATAKLKLEQIIEKAPLVVEETASLYFYRLIMNGRAQTGIAATFSVDDYDTNVIMKHEKTRKEKEDDRTKHIVTTGAQTGPVFLTYRGVKAVDEIVEKVTSSVTPMYDFTAVDGISHTIWVVPQEYNAAIIAAIGGVDKLYIADGHHRAASASRSRAAKQALNPAHNGSEEYNYFIAVLFPADQLAILPYYRVVKDLNGKTEEEFLNAVSDKFSVAQNGVKEPAAQSFCMYLNGSWYTLTPHDSVIASNSLSNSVSEKLDVSILQNFLLNPILGIDDPRTNKRIDFVGGIRGVGELEKLVNSGEFAVAFSLFPVTCDDLMNISDAGEIMPPKSTWFEPKLRDGLLVHTI
ncbi:MAG: DUF1015 family protein [Ignavibacteria bacterium]|nr:DUF1015 family protein [Ignavibacteria bacterium]